MLIGKVLNNRYELIEIIGQGGMAIVYKAKDQLLHRFVAVKILRQEFINDEQFIKKFKRESQSAASLSHHNIVNIYDVGVEEDIHFIVMELINGKTLKEYINDKQTLDWRKSISIALQISSALEHAHKNHIIHRDIKPHNIIMTPDDIAKVADFGIARAITSSTITQVEDTMGSVHYLSPEQARGGFVNEKSDLYSLGIVLYEMVTGKVPFDGDTSVAVALKHIQGEVIPPNQINTSVPESLNAIILKLLSKNSDERYDNATVLIKDLNRAFLEPNTVYAKEHFDENAPTQITPILPKEEEMEKSEDNNMDLTPAAEEKNEPKKKKKWPIILALIAIFAVASIVGAFIYSLSGSFRVEEVEVPMVENLPLDDAISVLRDNNLEFQISERRYSSEVDRDLVIQQDPEAGKVIKEDQVVSLIVSSGERQVTIPDIKNMYEAEAINQLENGGLEIGEITYEFNDEIESGRVISQSPRENLEVNEGTRIDLHVSRGEETISIPSIIGEHLEDAKDTLSSLGLELGDIQYENSGEYDKDHIIEQNPMPNEEVEKNTSVNIILSLGEISRKTIEVDLNQYEIDTDEDEEQEEEKDIRVDVRIQLLDYQDNTTELVYEGEHSISEGVLEIPVEGTGVHLYTIEINNEMFKEDFITF